MYLTIKLQLQASMMKSRYSVHTAGAFRTRSSASSDDIKSWEVSYLYHINGSVQISHFIPKIRYCTMRRLCMRSADCSIGPCIPAVFPVWRNLCSLRRIQLYSCLAKAFLFLNCVSEPKYINSSGSGYGVGNW